MNLKRAERMAKFKKIGQAINSLTPNDLAWRDYRGDHAFAMKNGDHGNRDDEDARNTLAKHRRLAGGPRFSTPQWERTVRKSK